MGQARVRAAVLVAVHVALARAVPPLAARRAARRDAASRQTRPRRPGYPTRPLAAGVAVAAGLGMGPTDHHPRPWRRQVSKIAYFYG